MMIRNLSCLVGVVALASGFVSDARAEKYPRMIAALGELKEAAKEMKEAKNDFGGHKEKALEATDQAIVQMEKALKAAKVDFTFTPPAKDVYKDYKNYPHIRHALDSLRTAHKEMKDAASDFGGHKEKALEAVDHAIAQLEKALEAVK
jgi:hypothetical protein